MNLGWLIIQFLFLTLFSFVPVPKRVIRCFCRFVLNTLQIWGFVFSLNCMIWTLFYRPMSNLEQTSTYFIKASGWRAEAQRLLGLLIIIINDQKSLVESLSKSAQQKRFGICSGLKKTRKIRAKKEWQTASRGWWWRKSSSWLLGTGDLIYRWTLRCPVYLTNLIF